MDDRSQRPRPDLEPDEVALDRLLAAAPPAALPVGFRDGVLAQITMDRSRSWEWLVAAAFALPSLAYVAWQLVTNGADFVAALGDIALVARTTDVEAPAFVVDGLVVLAMALLGLASIVATHALIATRSERVAVVR